MGEYWYTTSSGKRKRTAKGLKRQYELWDGTEEGKAKRAARNSARRSALKSGRVHKGDNKDVDHRNGVSAGNGSGNLRVMSATGNRGRAQGPRKRGSKRKRYGD